MSNPSKVIKASQHGWEGVQKKIYKTETNNFKDIHRYTLLGSDISELNMETRYFEIQPGGFSSLEMHRHPHSVVIIKGGGSVILNNNQHFLGLHDVVFIAPETIHQFHADTSQPLGFLCIVDRYRDKPQIPDDDQISKKITNPEVLKNIKK